jgi:tRNA U34 5-carboxymethylaminomethyl modifying GTPase MnmE/TrmE
MPDRTFAAERDGLREELARLADVAAERGSAATLESARALDAKLAQNRFNVVVFGEFKRGKTTFVNALLGAEMLPAAVVPLTSVVTAVTWGEEVRVRITYEGGREEEVPARELGRFVTERDNPGNHLGIRQAVLSYPSDDLRDGVFLVDTPGVGSVYRHNTEAAREFLPQADAAIFLVSADPPISDAEREFLEEIRDEAARVFFVLNKIDYLTGIDRDEAIAFTQGVIADAVGRDVVLYPMSARQALIAKLVGDEDELDASGLPAFERHLRSFLLREKGETILRSVAVRAARLVEAERNSLDVQERALELPHRELDEARRRMEEAFARARTAHRDLRVLLQGERDALVATVEEDLAALRREEEARLLRVVADFLANREDVRDAREELDALVKETLQADVDRWRRDEEARLGGSFREATARFVAEADRIESETVHLCGEILGIRLASEPAPIELPAESEFSFDFFEVPTVLESLLPDVRRFLPGGAARRLVERDLRRRIPGWVDKHSGRLRYDFVQRLDRSQRELRRALEDRLEATIGNLQAGIERSEHDRKRTQQEARSAGERLREFRSRLDRLRDAFLQGAGTGSDLEERTA